MSDANAGSTADGNKSSSPLDGEGQRTSPSFSGFAVLTPSQSMDVASSRRGWLLRLFESELFDSWMALAYLWKYNRKEVGIQFLLCEKLRKMPLESLEFLLPQLCQLMVCSPDESACLEYFMLELCLRSLHAAIFTMWYLENYLNDFHATYAKNAALYNRAVRLVQHLQHALFRGHGSVAASTLGSDMLDPILGYSTTPIDSTTSGISSIHGGISVPTSLAANLVGAGCSLASFGMPAFCIRIRPMVLMEARRLSQRRAIRSSLPDKSCNSNAKSPNISRSFFGPLTESAPSLEDLHHGKAFSLREYIVKAAKQINVTPPTFMMLSNSQETSIAESNRAGSAFVSNGTTSANSPPSSSSALPATSSALAIPPPIPLYYYAEMQFVMSLIDISKRLLFTPKDGRLKALNAELALINHNLPASLCIPLWCQGGIASANKAIPSTTTTPAITTATIKTPHNSTRTDPNEIDASSEHSILVDQTHSASLVYSPPDQMAGSSNPCTPINSSSVYPSSPLHSHHRILRISPSDSVVLNSAERVPYLVHLEILEGDYSETEFLELVKHCKESTATITTTTTSDSLNPGSRSTTPKLKVPTRSQSLSGLSSDSMTFKTMDASSDPENLIRLPPRLQTPIKRRPSLQECTRAIDISSPLNGSMVDELLQGSTPLTADDFSERMRTAAIMLAQLTRQATLPRCTAQKLADIAAIKARIIREMETLEKNRLLDALQQRNDQDADLPSRESLLLMMEQKPLFDREDPSAAVFQEGWAEKWARLRAASPYGHLEGWNLISVIVKSGADMRQEQLACQIIREMTRIWQQSGVPLWTYCYRVLVTSSSGGLVETVPNAISIHSIKKNAYTKNMNQLGYTFTLRDHFIKTFGSPDSEPFINARRCFIESLAAYSLVTFILQVKDRHDGNILLDSEGHLIHIDFGFMLSNSPGYVGFESAPFKLSPEYIELLGGLHSDEFGYFKDLVFRGFLELRKHADRILLLVEIMQKDSRLPCFYAGESAIAQLRQRLQLTLTEPQARQVIDRLITSSAYNIFTKLYDTFQYYSNGIL